MRDVARKGDRALIVGLTVWYELNGLIVDVLTDPEVHTFTDARTGRIITGRQANQVDLVAADKRYGWIATESLIPLRDPDADVTVTRTKELTHD